MKVVLLVISTAILNTAATASVVGSATVYHKIDPVLLEIHDEFVINNMTTTVEGGPMDISLRFFSVDYTEDDMTEYFLKLSNTECIQEATIPPSCKRQYTKYRQSTQQQSAIDILNHVPSVTYTVFNSGGNTIIIHDWSIQEEDNKEASSPWELLMQLASLDTIKAIEVSSTLNNI